MRLGLKTFLAVLLAAALVVPGATAKPGNGNGGNGGGGGKPSWAGPPSDRGGGGGGAGKPSWAGQGQEQGEAKKAEKAAAKAERAQAKAASAQAAKAERAQGKPDLANLDELTPEDLEGLNPAWTCKTERALLGDAFADEHGTNENDANAFGMCVSEEAQERDGVSEEAVETFCEPGVDGGEPSEDGICPGDDSGMGAAAAGLSDEDGSEEGDLLADDGEGSEDEGDGSGEPASILALLRSLF